MTRRPGMTLVEIQVAIFVVAIGLTGVIAMFPYGAKQMGDALTADRTTTHAAAMDGLVRGEWKGKVVERAGDNEPYWNALDDPNPSATGTLPKIPPTSTEPSYPVFLDPMGVVGRSSTNKDWVGDMPAAANGNTPFTSVPRRNMNLVANSSSPTQVALRVWSQADGFGFDEDGRPLANPAEMRELRYNALAVIQRPVNRDRYRATLKIVVFGGRRHLFYPTGSEAVFNNVTFTPGSTKLQLPTSADIKKGSWIMDGTVAGGIRHANFYRVVSATENTAGTYDVELNTPVTRVDGQTAAYTNGTVVVLAGVLDVFERPALSGGTNP